MISTINIAAYSDALVVLGTAGILVPIISRLGISPTLGYLVAGAILGPLGLGSFIRQVPVLYWFTVGDAKNVEGIAELGVVFLLFLIGLELSFQRLLTMRRYVFGLGGLQVLLTTGLIAAVAAKTGQKPADAVILGASLSLSSTAIVLELLSKQERLTTGAGRASFSVLLAQDIAVIPILMFVSILAGGHGKSVLASLAGALVSAALALSVIILFGRVLMRPLFRLVASDALAGPVHRRGAVCHRRRGSGGEPGRPLHGAWRFRRRPAACRNRIPQGDRSDGGAVQVALARHFLLHGWHGDRLPRARARAAAAVR